MPTLKSMSIDLGGREVFRPGEIVSGVWELDIGDAISVRGVRITLQGAAYTRWSPFNYKKDDKIGHERFTSQWVTVFGKQIGEDGPNVTLPVGVHKYNFRFQLPSDGLPSSFEGVYGSVRYWLMLEIDRPLLRFNITRYSVMTILDDININLPEYTVPVGGSTEKKVSKALGFGNQGNVLLQAQTDRTGYCPGEHIAISLTAKNNSERDLGVVKASLVQTVTFFASGEEKVEETSLCSVTGKVLNNLKGESRAWDRLPLKIFAIPPSTRPRSCHVVIVQYHVKVFVDVALVHGGDVALILPVTIGTVPQAYQAGPQGGMSGAGLIPVVDASAAITYTRCALGIRYFDNGDADLFPVMNYVPMCAFVPNFKLKATPAQPLQVASPPFMVAQPLQTAVPNVRPGPLPPSLAKPLQFAPASAKPGSIAPTMPLQVAPPGVNVGYIAQPVVQGGQLPSAPPLEPPSYSEATSNGQPAPIQPNIGALSLNQVRDMSASQKRFFMILTFPHNVLSDFRNILNHHVQFLGSYSGQLIALSSEVTVSSGNWLQDSSLSAFLFSDKFSAKQWFTEFDKACETSGVAICNAIVGPSRDTYDNEKRFFSLSVMKLVVELQSPDFKEYSHRANSDTAPIRKTLGGVTFVSTRVIDHLRGNWPPRLHTMTIAQWPELEDHTAYEEEINSSAYRQYQTCYARCFQHVTTISFQSEDISMPVKQ